ncbi:MAG: hypothetical protein AAGD01_07410 [Acidobacteriota bacterium]
MTLRFERQFVVSAPLAQVAAFHSSAESLKAITPPLAPMHLEEVPDPLVPGCEMSFRTWVGPFPMYWRAKLEELPGLVSGPGIAGFVDRQLEGPFELWVHQHRFEAQGPESTLVHDRIEARLPSFWSRPRGFLTALSMWLGLAPLFLYRRWQTRRRLRGRG